LRFAASVMMVSGLLLIADAAITLAWQEPVSSLLAKREQARLGRELDALARDFHGGDYAELAQRLVRQTEPGDPIGRIELPSLDRSYVMVEGTGTRALRKGPGHYGDTPLPGQRGTVGVAGHRTTYLAPFRTIDRLDAGDEVVASMPYGRFTYRVERRRIVEPTALWVKRRASYDRLVLSACHPLYSAAQRVVVFARLVRSEPARP